MDRSLQESAEAILRGSAHPPLRRVTCELRDNSLILRGLVPSFHLKQLAQSLVQSTNRDIEVDNQIEVS